MEAEELRVGKAVLDSYELYRDYRTNAGKYSAPQWVNGCYDDFRFGVTPEFELGMAAIKAGLLPEPK